MSLVVVILAVARPEHSIVVVFRRVRFHAFDKTHCAASHWKSRPLLPLPHTHHKVLTGSPSLFGKRPLSLYSLCYLANLCIDTDDHRSLMATSNTATWRCRQCLASGTTADFTSHGHMKSHLARHGYGTWRCTDCPVIGLRKYALSH
jgi:hypothetical protein